ASGSPLGLSSNISKRITLCCIAATALPIGSGLRWQPTGRRPSQFPDLSVSRTQGGFSKKNPPFFCIGGGQATMPGNPEECRIHAANCRSLAEQATSKEATETFSNLAEQWEKLATELVAAQTFLEAMAELDSKKPSPPQGSG